MKTIAHFGISSIILKICFFALFACGAGCAGLKNRASFEMIDSSKSRAASLCVLDNVHSLNPTMESAMAADLTAALAGRGLRIAANPAESDMVLVPTLGRVLEEGSTHEAQGAVREPGARQRSLILSPSQAGMTLARESRLSQSSGASFSARTEWRAGLLLTAYDRKELGGFDPATKSLSPVWRAYANIVISEPSWRSASKPLIEAVAESVAENLR